MSKVVIEAIVKKEKETGDLVLLFPYQIENRKGNFTCFTLNEGHSLCAYDWYLTETKPLTDQDLRSTQHQNLVNYYLQDFDLKIIKKINARKQGEAIRAFNLNHKN